MELRLLKYFWTDATAGTVSKAADSYILHSQHYLDKLKNLNEN